MIKQTTEIIHAETQSKKHIILLSFLLNQSVFHHITCKAKKACFRPRNFIILWTGHHHERDFQMNYFFYKDKKKSSFSKFWVSPYVKSILSEHQIIFLIILSFNGLWSCSGSAARVVVYPVCQVYCLMGHVPPTTLHVHYDWEQPGWSQQEEQRRNAGESVMLVIKESYRLFSLSRHKSTSLTDYKIQFLKDSERRDNSVFKTLLFDLGASHLSSSLALNFL